jgi:hypothetical protein
MRYEKRRSPGRLLGRHQLPGRGTACRFSRWRAIVRVTSNHGQNWPLTSAYCTVIKEQLQLRECANATYAESAARHRIRLPSAHCLYIYMQCMPPHASRRRNAHLAVRAVEEAQQAGVIFAHEVAVILLQVTPHLEMAEASDRGGIQRRLRESRLRRMGFTSQPSAAIQKLMCGIRRVAFGSVLTCTWLAMRSATRSVQDGSAPHVNASIASSPVSCKNATTACHVSSALRGMHWCTAWCGGACKTAPHQQPEVSALHGSGF